MEFINKNIDSLNILQQFIDNDAVIYGESVLNILKENKIDVVKIYLPSPEVIENINNLKLTFDKCEIKQVTNNKQMWKINDLWILTTTRIPSILIKDNDNMCITKYGVSTFHSRNGLNILKYLRNINNKEVFDDAYVNLSSKWVTYFLNEEHSIYGSWPTRYITANNSDEMHRDIDISVLGNKNYKKICSMMNLLADSNMCDLTNINFPKYESTSMNVKITINSEILNFDIHKAGRISCDAFYNNLKLTQKYLTINYKPHNVNFINILILTFKDLFSNNYTLIKQFPIRYDTMGDFRLIVKPYMFSAKRTINYDYLETNKNADEKINKLEDVITNNKCCKNCNHEPNNDFEIPSTSVIKLNKKFKCVQCIYNHITLWKKNIKNKSKSESENESESESESENENENESKSESENEK